MHGVSKGRISNWDLFKLRAIWIDHPSPGDGTRPHPPGVHHQPPAVRDIVNVWLQKKNFELETFKLRTMWIDHPPPRGDGTPTPTGMQPPYLVGREKCGKSLDLIYEFKNKEKVLGTLQIKDDVD